MQPVGERHLLPSPLLPLLLLGLHGGASWLQGDLQLKAEHWHCLAQAMVRQPLAGPLVALAVVVVVVVLSRSC
jgi:hypothetical protein